MYSVFVTGVAIGLAGITTHALRRLKRTDDRLQSKTELADYMYGQYMEATGDKVQMRADYRDLLDEHELLKNWGIPHSVGQPKKLVLSASYFKDEVDLHGEELLEKVSADLVKEAIPYIRWTSSIVDNTMTFNAELFVLDRGPQNAEHDIQRDHV